MIITIIIAIIICQSLSDQIPSDSTVICPFLHYVVDSDAPVIESSKKGKKLAVYEAPKPQNYFHLEYKLFPDDIEPVKTDVVVYGVAAKIYNENESKVLKTWKEGDKIWIAWRRR